MKQDSVYLRHILDCIAQILEYTCEGEAVFFGSPMEQDAVIRNLEVIGEAVKNLSPALRARSPAIAWSRIAGMRDVLIHEYFGVDLQIVWSVVENRLPGLQAEILDLLQSPPEREP